jgi:glycosyltransferase involved in cell wall biosynthesis
VRDHGHAPSRRHVRKRTVAFVADELLGYAGNGIGTTTTFVSLALARLGHDVRILFAGAVPAGPPEPEWQRLYDDAGVRVDVVPRQDIPVEPRHFARARDVEAALRADPPDVVVVQDLGAPAYTAIRLRSLGLAFEGTAFVVFCHGTRQWITDVSRKVRVLPGAQGVTLLERASVELADAVVSPSAYLVDWMQDAGWELPPRTFVIPHISRAGATGDQPLPPPVVEPLEHLAFFGRLEERKGVRPFVAALNALERELLARVDVTFVGRPTPPWPIERVQRLISGPTRNALRGLSFETSLDQHEALDRLRQPGTVAVIPSFEENSPNVVYECLENGIPFVASNVAGIRELVAPEDRARILFEPTEEGVAEALRSLLGATDPPRPAKSAFSERESLRRWEEVLELSATPFPPPSSDAADEHTWALLLAEGDLPEADLGQTLLRAQQLSNADVVTCGLVVDQTVHLFPGEPRGLGLLGNGYGTAGLIRRSLLDATSSEPVWPLLARLSVAGAKIVSVPLPLVHAARRPATVDSDPDQARLVVRHFEEAMPPSARLLAELVPRLTPSAARRPPERRQGLARRVAKRLLAR